LAYKPKNGRWRNRIRDIPIGGYTPPPKTPIRVCDHPTCNEEATYRAPKNRELTDYYWFCLEHVQQYNRSWDYFQGMNEQEIEDEIRADTCWQRPTWKLGDRISPTHLYRLHDIFELFREEEKKKRHRPSSDAPTLPEDFQAALSELEMDFPFTLDDVKKQYKVLVKQYHPDVNGGSKEAENKFKKVSVAYKLVISTIERMPEMMDTL
jgi:hypothetical protein